MTCRKPGTGTFGARHLYIIKFRIGITTRQIVEEIKSEPNVRSVFTDLIYESHIAEMDGRVALVMIIEGKNDADIIENVQGKIVPSLRKNHGPDSIEEISTLRLLSPIRVFHNYVPLVNMDKGVLRGRLDGRRHLRGIEFPPYYEIALSRTKCFVAGCSIVNLRIHERHESRLLGRVQHTGHRASR